MPEPGGARDPHAASEVFHAGASLDRAAGAVLLVHGRGGTARGMLEMAAVLELSDLALLAPQAAGGAWYPFGFMEPLERNQPWLSSALNRLGRVVAELEERGLGSERLALIGFSQGACLALEFAARNARKYGGVAGLSGGLIGPESTPGDYSGTFHGTPVFLGCSDIDPHIPVERVRETAEVLRGLGAEVDERIYPGMGHTVNREEIEAVRMMLAAFSG